MAKFITGQNRNQLVLFPEKLEDLINEDNEVRIIDKFVETLDLGEMKFKRVVPNNKGTNSFNPKDLLKLYLYGYRNKVRSSRKLENLCKVNIEVKWLLRGLEPDFRTISDFRKENVKAMKEVFKQTVVMGKELKLIGNQFSQDGYKVQAVNSKERNYTLNKLDDRIKRENKKLLDEVTKKLTKLSEKKEKEKAEIEKEAEAEIEKYLKEIEEEDKKESGQEIIEFTEEMVEVAKRLKKHKKIRKEIEESGERQKSLTDKEARLMKNNEKYEVSYNVQEVTDTKSHLVMEYKANNNPADSGTLEEMSEATKEITGKEIIDNITDKGYLDRDDMAKCLEKGIRPQVTLPENEEYFEVEFEYVENEISEKEKKSRNEKKIKKCLEAGVIPEVYKKILSEVKVEEKKEVIELEGLEEEEEIDEEDLRRLGMKEGCFVKDKKHNKVFCPQGEVLRPKSNHGNKVKYCNKLACQRCKNPCTRSKYKELLMGPNQIVSTVGKKKGNSEIRKKYNKTSQKKVVIKKVVKAKLIPEKRKLKKRMRTSEHVHGTLKRTDDASYLLLKGKEKVNGELALSYCAINLRRLINLVTYDKLIEYLNNKLVQRGVY